MTQQNKAREREREIVPAFASLSLSGAQCCFYEKFKFNANASVCMIFAHVVKFQLTQARPANEKGLFALIQVRAVVAWVDLVANDYCVVYCNAHMYLDKVGVYKSSWPALDQCGYMTRMRCFKAGNPSDEATFKWGSHCKSGAPMQDA